MPGGPFVAPVYAAIFNVDPLLLSEQHQNEYGSELLKNLLVYRPLTTSKPNRLDLQNPTPPRALPALPAPSHPLRTAYHDARLKRIDLITAGMSAAQIEDLMKMTMVSDDRTHDRANNGHKNHDAIRGSLGPRLLAFDDRLRIAAIGFRVAISRLQDLHYLDEDLHFRRPVADSLVLPPETGVDSQLGRTEATGAPLDPWHQAIGAHVQKSLDRNSQIVVLPEFGLPPASGGRATIQSELAAICAPVTTDYFVFAGTRHEDRYNRGLILSRRLGRTSTSDHWHHKIASARGLGETVLGPAGKDMKSYKTGTMIGADEVMVAVAICYDTYDPTTFLNLFLDTARHLKGAIPRIILVPSFNPSADFVALLRDLSFLARCMVVYVNGLHGDAAMFMCGFDLADFDANLATIFSSITTRQQDLQNNVQQILASVGGGVATPDQQRQLQLKSYQLTQLTILETRLRNLRARGELDHIITYEDCPTCGAARLHTADRTCFRDIQYYNISTALLAALFDFRKQYFGEELFLPEPFRRDKLDQAAQDIDGP
jgi:hypothetical protein